MQTTEYEYDENGNALAISTTTGTQIVKQGFQGLEMRQQAEMAAIAMAEHAKASIEARCILAERHPRSWLDVQQRLLAECERPGFAAAARYRKPVGKKKNETTGEWEQNYVEGFSIRFAEAALRYMRNVVGESTVIYDDVSQRLVRITVMDLETNATIAIDVAVPKTVEKKQLRKGQMPVSSRINSYGDRVFLVEATDDEITTKQAALVSKALRNGILRLLPGDIQDECEERCAVTVKKADAADPMAATNKVLEAFRKIGIMPIAIGEYIGREPSLLQPAELAELRGIYQAIKDGDLSWATALEAKTGKGSDDKETQKKVANVEATLERAKQKVAEKAAERGKSKGQKPGAGEVSDPLEAAAATEQPRERQSGED